MACPVPIHSCSYDQCINTQYRCDIFLLQGTLGNTTFDCLDFCSHQIGTKRELCLSTQPLIISVEKKPADALRGLAIYPGVHGFSAADPGLGRPGRPGSQPGAHSTAAHRLLPASVGEAGVVPLHVECLPWSLFMNETRCRTPH